MNQSMVYYWVLSTIIPVELPMPRRREQPNQCVHWGTINNTNLSPSLSFTPLLPCLLAHSSHSTCWLVVSCNDGITRTLQQQVVVLFILFKWALQSSRRANIIQCELFVQFFQLNCSPFGNQFAFSSFRESVRAGSLSKHSGLQLFIKGEKVGSNPLIWVEWQPLIWPGGRQTQTEASLLSVGDLRGIKQRVIKS